MPAVVRDGDMTATGHGCTAVCAVTGPTGASAMVFANGIPVECKGNPTVIHTILVGPSCVPHVANINAGSGTVFVGGIPIARIGDSCDAGVLMTGSPDVFADG